MTAKLMKFTIPEQAPAVTEKSAAKTVQLRGKDETDSAAVERAAETDLLEKLQSQQSSAVFDELFRRFAPKLKSYLISLGSAHDTAESVVQDVMTTVWTKSHLFDSSKASARTWIFTLVRNRYIDLKRAEARQSKAYDQYAESGIETETSSEIQLNHTAGQQVSLLLKKLPKEQAEILLMAYVEGKSHREIAEQLGVPIGTTKSRVRLAFQRLRKLMENPNES